MPLAGVLRAGRGRGCVACRERECCGQGEGVLCAVSGSVACLERECCRQGAGVLRAVSWSGVCRERECCVPGAGRKFCVLERECRVTESVMLCTTARSVVCCI